MAVKASRATAKTGPRVPNPRPYYDWDKMPTLLKTPHLAILFGTDERTVRSWLQAGQIPGAGKIGERVWFVERDMLRRYFTGETPPPQLSDADMDDLAERLARKLVATTWLSAGRRTSPKGDLHD